MKQLFQEAIEAKLHWDEVSGPLYQTTFQNKTIQLRMNDFPDEPFWTLLIDGEGLDLEETPPEWTLPYHEQSNKVGTTEICEDK